MHNFFFPLSLLIFAALSILIPGFFIWIGLKIIGEDRSVIRCGLANLVALVSAFIIATLLSFTPLALFSPLIYLIVYLYVLKEFLDISFLEALAATVISALVVFVVSLVVALAFGTWMLFFMPKPHMGFPHF